MKEKAFEYIDSIAAKLGVAAEHVYGVLVRQQYADGIVTIVLILGLMAIFLPTFIYSLKRTDWNVFDHQVIITMLTGAGLIPTVIIGGIEGSEAIKQLINPEYYAIKELIDAIGGKQ